MHIVFCIIERHHIIEDPGEPWRSVLYNSSTKVLDVLFAVDLCHSGRDSSKVTTFSEWSDAAKNVVCSGLCRGLGEYSSVSESMIYVVRISRYELYLEQTKIAKRFQIYIYRSGSYARLLNIYCTEILKAYLKRKPYQKIQIPLIKL